MLWWIAQHVAVTAALAAGVRLLCSTRRIGPAACHAMWLLVLVKLLMPPLLVWPWSVPALPALGTGGAGTPGHAGVSAASNPAALAQPSNARPASNKAGVPVNTGPVFMWPIGPSPTGPDRSAVAAKPPPAAAQSAAPPGSMTWHAQLLALAAWTWIAGALVVLAIHCLRIAGMLRLTRRGSPAGPDLQRAVDALAGRLNVRPVETRVVGRLHSPLIWCTHAPLLLWPAALDIRALPAQSLRGLIAHELAHVRRRDHWVGWLELLGSCVWWWNPLFWYVLHQLREQSELACDAWVVQLFPQGRRAYAEGLLAVCQSICQHSPAANLPITALGADTGSRRFLERRLTMIVRENKSSRLTRLGLIGVMLLGGATLPAWSQEAAPAAGQTQKQSPANPPDQTSTTGTAADQSTAANTVTSAIAFLSDVNYVYAAAPGLPPEAQKIVDDHNKNASAAREELEKKLAEDRQAAIRELRELQDRYTRDAKLDEAVAIRDTIRQLVANADRQALLRAVRLSGGPGLIAGSVDRNSGPAIVGSNLIGSSSIPGPANAVPDLSAFRGRTGLMILMQVTGSTEGTVWGSETYTDDSSIPAAAVHAGILKPGETGLVAIVLQPGQASYKGSTNNGVTSQPYNEWQGSFTISRAPESRSATDPLLGTRYTTAVERIYTNADKDNSAGKGSGNSTSNGDDPNNRTGGAGTTPPPTPDSTGGSSGPGAGGARP